MSACVNVASDESKELGSQVEKPLPPGSVMMEEGIYMVPVGEDEGTGCIMYTMVARVPGKSVIAAIHWRTSDGEFVLDEVPGLGVEIDEAAVERYAVG